MIDPFPGRALLTPTQVIAMLGIGKSTFYRLEKEAGFPRGVLLGGRKMFRKDDILRFIERLPEAPLGPDSEKGVRPI